MHALRVVIHRLYLTLHVLRVNTVEAMVDGLTLTKDGQVDPNELAKWVRQASRMGLTGEDAAKLAAYKSVSYRFGVYLQGSIKHLILTG